MQAVEFYPTYFAHPDGSITNRWGRKLKYNNAGKLDLLSQGQRRQFMVARLIYEAFVGEIPPNYFATKIDPAKGFEADNLQLKYKSHKKNEGTVIFAKCVKSGTVYGPFDNIIIAADEMGVDKAKAQSSLYKKQKYAGGYIFYRAKE